MAINKTIIQGRFTADPEVKKTKSDISYCDFTIAWSSKFKDDERRLFQRCKAWRSTAEMIGKYFAKGQECIVDGELQTEEYEKDGEKRSVNKLIVNQIHFCGKKETGNSETVQPVMTPIDPDGDLPF